MKKIISILLIITLLLCVTINSYGLDNEKIEVKFNSAVDGDTAKFEMNGEVITARFLAIDTPETVHPNKEVEPYGKEASNYTKEKLENANKIELEFDSNSDEKDKYNRYLVWVWVDEELLQDLLVKQGLAQVAYLYGYYKYTEQLQQSQNIAKENKLNMWSDKEYKAEENTYKEENSTKTEEFDIINILEVLAIAIVLIILKKLKKK